MLNEYACGPADVRLPDAAEHDPQHRVGVGHRADGGPDVGAHPLLVEDDRGRQAFERVDVWPGQRRHETLHKGAVGLVDQPLRLRGDRAEHERALARAGNAGEHGQPAFRDVEVDVAEVVLAGAADLDGAPGRRSRSQPAAFLMSSAIRASDAGVSSITANAVGPHLAVVEVRVGLEAEGRVADLELRLGLEEGDHLPSCPPWRTRACRSTSSGRGPGAASETIAWIRSAIARSGSGILAMLSRRSLQALGALLAGLRLRRGLLRSRALSCDRGALFLGPDLVASRDAYLLLVAAWRASSCSPWSTGVGRQAVAFWAALPCWRIRIGLPNGSRMPMSVP